MTSTRARRRTSISAAELKRQLAATKLELYNAKAALSNTTEELKAEQGAVYSGITLGTPPPLEPMEPISIDAKQRPVEFKKYVETEEQQVGQDHPRVMKSTGPAKDSLEPAYIQPVGRVYSPEKMELLKFMEEEVTVMLHDSTNPTDEQIPCVWNDGRSQYFIRGKSQRVKRKFIEVLARAKKTTFTQEKDRDADGNEFYRQVPHTALIYPFNTEGDSPRGQAWLKQILAEY